MDNRNTSLVDHRISLLSMISLRRDTQINMDSNEVTMDETNRPTA